MCAAFVVFDYKCPFLRLTGFPCPGCGMTRAYKSLLAGDLSAAFAYHPLFALAPILVLEIALYSCRPAKHREILLFALCLLFAVTWLLRLLLGWRG